MKSIINSIFSFMWRKRLIDYKLIKVVGWRSCIIDSKSGDRIRGTFLFGRRGREKRDGREKEINTFNWRTRDLNDTSTSGI